MKRMLKVNKFVIILALLFTTQIFAAKLRILNIPINSTIIIDDMPEFKNEDNRIMEFDLQEKLLSSYDVKIINKEFMTNEFSVNVQDEKVTTYTLKMTYARTFYTNVFVESERYGLDNCVIFECSVSEGENITNNTFAFRENFKNTKVKFTAKGRGFYDETDVYDITKDQLITLDSVSSWGLLSVGVTYAAYPGFKSLDLKSDNKYIKYTQDSTSLTGIKVAYKKNTPFNFYLAGEYNYMFHKETQVDPVYGDIAYSGDVAMDLHTLGAAIGYSSHWWFVEVGARDEFFMVAKSFTDTTYSAKFNKIAGYLSFSAMNQTNPKSGIGIELTISSSMIISASLLLGF